MRGETSLVRSRRFVSCLCVLGVTCDVFLIFCASLPTVSFVSSWLKLSLRCVRFPLLGLIMLSGGSLCAQQGTGPAPYNDLIVRLTHTMPTFGGYSAGHGATERLRGAVTVASPLGLNIAAEQAQPSYCSGATYLVFLKAVDVLCRQGVIQPDDRAMSALLISGQRDGEGIWGRWNANGPGTARLFYELGVGTNFTDIAQARPGDFMKIWWSTEVGRREHGHSVIYLGTEKVNGVDSVRFWSSNLGMGYGEKTVPLSKVKGTIFSRFTVPQNVLRAPQLSPRVDPYLARLLTTDSNMQQVRDECGI